MASKASVKKQSGLDKSAIASLQESRNYRDDMLVERWHRTPVGVKLDKIYESNRGKARLVAHALEMQNRHMKSLKEAGTLIKSAFQTTPENLLRIVRIGAANSNRSEIFNEWSLETPDDAFFFVDTIYGKTKRGATAGDLVYENTYPNYATEIDQLILGTGNGATLTFSGNFVPVPIIPSTVRIFVAGKPVGQDNGSGVITGATMDTGSVVNYTTGATTVVFTAGNAPVTGAQILMEANFDSEDSANYDEWGSIELKLRKERFNARLMPLEYKYSQLLELTLGSTGIGNVDEMLVKRVGDEHAKRKDLKAFQIAMREARRNTIETFNADFATAGSDNAYNHAQFLITRLAEISGGIYDSQQRGGITRIVAGSKALARFQLLKNWTSDATQNRVSGSYKAGSIDGIDVYSTPSHANTVATDEALLVYRNPVEDGDIAIAFGVMTELASTLDYPELYRHGSVATVEDYKVINSNFLRILKFQNV